MALIGKGRAIIAEERPSARREENPSPSNPRPNPAQNLGSEEELKETVKELADLLEAQAELIQETAEELAPKPAGNAGNGSEQSAEHVSDVRPLNEPQAPNPLNTPTPVQTTTPPPTPPESQKPSPPQKKRNGLAGLFLGKR